MMTALHVVHESVNQNQPAAAAALEVKRGVTHTCLESHVARDECMYQLVPVARCLLQTVERLQQFADHTGLSVALRKFHVNVLVDISIQECGRNIELGEFVIPLGRE